MKSTCLLMVPFTVFVACGSPGGESDDDSPPDAQVGVAFDFERMCTRIATDVSACASVDHVTCVTAFQLAAGRGCAPWLDDLETWIVTHQPAYECLFLPGLGLVPTIAGTAPEAAQIGDACTASLSNDSCYAISCNSSLDCPTGYSCNDATGHCFDSSATCTGAPCAASLDCPTGETCNSAAGVCIRN